MTVELTLTSNIDVRLLQKMGGDAAIAASAKVLEPDAYSEYLKSNEKRSIGGLIRYLMQHRHGSPFHHSAISFFVNAPIFVWREWHRHRTMSYNEQSARYKTLDPVFYIPPRERPMMCVEDWKPTRPKFTRCEDDGVYRKLCSNLEEVYRLGYSKYQENLSLGIDPGLARDCLPVGIFSSCWVTTCPRNLMHFLSLRTHEPKASFVSFPLYEIEVPARICERIFEANWPITYAAFCEFGRVAP
jgi:thymidylate synthase (FAD)